MLATNKKDIGGITLDSFLIRMLSSSWGGTFTIVPSSSLEAPAEPFTGTSLVIDVIITFPGDFIYLIDKNNTFFCCLNIIISDL